MRSTGLAIVAVILAGCAHPDIYDKPGGTVAQFHQDFGYCKLVAMNAPQYAAPQLPPAYTATTTYTGSMAITNVQAQPNPGQGLAELGAALGNIARQREALHDCMEVKGYTLRQQ